MNTLSNQDITEQEPIDFPTMMTGTCHLMTLYALNPCKPLATNINQHIHIILNSSINDPSGEWKSTFKHMLAMWELIADQDVHPTQLKQQHLITQ